MKRHRQPLEALKEIEEQVEALEEQVEKPVERRELDVKTDRRSHSVGFESSAAHPADRGRGHGAE